MKPRMKAELETSSDSKKHPLVQRLIVQFGHSIRKPNDDIRINMFRSQSNFATAAVSGPYAAWMK